MFFEKNPYELLYAVQSLDVHAQSFNNSLVKQSLGERRERSASKLFT